MFPMNPAEAGARTNREQWIAMTRREWAWLCAASLAFAVVFAYPMLCETVYLGPGTEGWISRGPIFSHLARFPANGDWDLFTELRWVPYYTVSHFHQFPYWNPYKCGGMGLLGNPESAIVTPFFIPYLLFGPYAGLYIEIILHMAIGFAGGYALGRVLGFHRLASVVCAIVFPASSWLGLHLAVGHLNFLPSLYLPWIAALFLVSIEHKKLFPATLAGVICALTLTEGNYSFLYAGIFLALSGLVLSVLRLSLWPIVSGLVVGLFAGGFAALKLLPAWEMLTLHPRAPFGPEWDTFPMMMVYLLSRNQDMYRNGVSVFLLSEYGASISFAFAVLGAIGVATAPRKYLPWILPALIFFWLAEGDTGPHSALMLLRHFPLTGNIDLPARFIIPFVFCAGLIIAQGAHFLCSRVGKYGVAAVAILLVVGSVDAWMVGAPNFRYLFHNETHALPPSERFRQYWVSNPGIQTEIAQANMGSVNCQGYGYNSVPEDALGYNQSGYRGEYYLLGSGQVVETQWTPNRLSYEVDAPLATSLVINQNMYPGWRMVEGQGELYAEHGLIAVRLPPGRQRLSLRFQPSHIIAAFLVTLAALGGLVTLWLMDL